MRRQVRAVGSADSSAAVRSPVTLQNPAPVLAGLALTSVPAGASAITENGSGFVSGARALLAGAPLATTFVPSTLYAMNAFGRTAATINTTVQ
jgi:hypothetical protein